MHKNTEEREEKIMDYLTIANGIPMWIACGIAVALVLCQAFIFARRSYKTGKQIGLTEPQMKGAMKSAAITSIGPSIVILSSMLSLLVSVGGPMAWMRLSFIGSVMFEGMAAGFGTSAVGVTLGSDAMTNVAFGNAVWTMILGSIGWIIFATLFAGQMDKVEHKITKGDGAMLSTISVCAILGSFGGLSGGHIVKWNKNTIACVVGGLTMFVLITLAKKKNIKWLNEWALTISLFAGMLSTLLF
jgi:hypothetical protein